MFMGDASVPVRWMFYLLVAVLMVIQFPFPHLATAPVSGSLGFQTQPLWQSTAPASGSVGFQTQPLWQTCFVRVPEEAASKRHLPLAPASGSDTHQALQKEARAAALRYGMPGLNDTATGAWAVLWRSALATQRASCRRASAAHLEAAGSGNAT